jgi:hypothetical protein
MPHHVGVTRPVVRDAGDAAERVIGMPPGGVHLADDRMLGPGDCGQRRQRGAHTVVTVVHVHRLENVRRRRQVEFGCRGE